MQAFQRFAITAVFTLTCFSVPVLQAGAATAPGGVEAGANAGAGQGKVSPTGPAAMPASPGEVGTPGSGTSPVGGPVVEVPGEGGGKDGVGKVEREELVRDLGQQFQEQHRELKERVDAARRSRTAVRRREERQTARENAKALRGLDAKALGVRQELLDLRFDDLRKPRDLKELIDAAKEAAKDRKAETVRERRGRGD